MNILILNRRDIANPAGGGAEIYTHKIASGLVIKYNCQCVVFSSRFTNSAAEEVIDGVTYLRKGNEATVHPLGFIYAVMNRKKFDLIIDEFNGIGFFTFFLRNSVLLIHQLYREFWFQELGAAGVLPYLLEPLLLRFYRNRQVITISDSTRGDLASLGFRKIKIVMVGLERSSEDSSSPEGPKSPVMVFLGRLKSTKRPDLAIDAFKKIREQFPDVELWMIGRGPEDARLKRMASEIGGITFWGWVDDRKKMELLRRTRVLFVPSVREGFGINIIEAASVGIPSVGFNVHGVRDAIIEGKTGFLVDDVNGAAARIAELLDDSALRHEMALNCRSYADGFNWQKRVDEFREIIKNLKK